MWGHDRRSSVGLVSRGRELVWRALSVAFVFTLLLVVCCSDDDGEPADPGSKPPPCDEDPCKLTSPQCGCPAGTQCTLSLLGYGFRLCEDESAAAAGWGELCGACGPGLFCLADLGIPTCHKFCEEDADCESPGGRCALEVMSKLGEAIPDAMVCFTNCDPVDSTGCAAGTKCILGQLEEPPNEWHTECIGQGTVAHGEACSSWDECAAGACVAVDGGASQCLDWCDRAAPDCPGNNACVANNPPMVVGSVEYGICLPPS